MKLILITGIGTGSAKHLLPLLTGNNLIGIYNSHKPDYSNIKLMQIDLTDSEMIEKCFDENPPDEIYHLAGSATNVYDADYRNNFIILKNILDNIRKLQLSTKILVIGSSAEYGLQEKYFIPVKETNPTNPVSFYGLTKLMQTHLALLYSRLYGIDIRIARTFNVFDMESRNTNLFIGRVLSQIDEIHTGIRDKITVGNLEAKRDYINVSDVALAYNKIMEKGKSGEIYNVGSGKSASMSDILTMLLSPHSLTRDIVEEQVVNTNSKINIPDLVADMTKLNNLQ